MRSPLVARNDANNQHSQTASAVNVTATQLDTVTTTNVQTITLTTTSIVTVTVSTTVVQSNTQTETTTESTDTIAIQTEQATVTETSKDVTIVVQTDTVTTPVTNTITTVVTSTDTIVSYTATITVTIAALGRRDLFGLDTSSLNANNGSNFDVLTDIRSSRLSSLKAVATKRGSFSDYASVVCMCLQSPTNTSYTTGKVSTQSVTATVTAFGVATITS